MKLMLGKPQTFGQKVVSIASVDNKNLHEVLINAGLMGIATALTYFIQNSGDFSFGLWSPLIVAGLQMSLKYLQSWIDSRIKKEPVNPAQDEENFKVV